MDRRTFFGTTLGGVLCVALPTRATRSTSSYGPIDVDRWNHHKAMTGESLHAFLDGKDVTHRCYFADDVGGEVHLFKHDINGRVNLDKAADGAAKEVLHGHVVLIPGS